MKHLLILGWLCGVLFSFSGCATNKGPFVPAGQDPSTEDVYPAVLLDKSLTKKVAVDRVESRILDDGRLEVLANFRNQTRKDIVIQAQTVFKDVNNYSLGEDSAWSALFLSANETETYRMVSRGKDAAKFTIRIREER